MNKPIVTFKKVKYFRGMEGFGVNADVYINGVKCYFIMDSGDGGDMSFEENITGNPKDVVDNIKLLNDYIAQLPKEDVNIGGTMHQFKVKLEDYINDLLEKLETEKKTKSFNATMAKKFVNCIVIGVPNSGSYQFCTYPKNLNTYPKVWLNNQIKLVKERYCKNGVVILNNNIEHENL